MRPKFNLRNLLLATILIGTSLGLYVSSLSGDLVELSEDNFDKIVIANDHPVLVAFTADW